MKICLKCNQNCTDAEEVCLRCGGNQFRYIGTNGEQQRPPMAGQNIGVNRQRPPMTSQLNKNRMNNILAGMAGQNQGGFNPQRPMGQRPNNPNFGTQRPQQMGQTQNSMGQGQMGQRPKQAMNPNNRGNMGQNMSQSQMNQNIGQRPNINLRNMGNNPIQNGNAVVNNRSVPMTKLLDGDLPPKPDVLNLPPKEAKQVMKEWQKKVALQAKENKKLAKQQQDALKKVEQLKKKGKPVPPELEQLAAGAAIEAAHKNSRNNITAVRGQQLANGALQEDAEAGSEYEYTEETVTLAEWFKHVLICLIPIYSIIYLIKIVTGSKDSKPSLKEFAKLQLIFLIAAVVILIAAGLIVNIVILSMW